VDLYPTKFQLPELTAHLVALLERRRAGLGAWEATTEASLLAEARAALDEAGAQFREVVDDPAAWSRRVEQCLTVALPRYLKLAREQHALEARRYGVWRGGDLLSRAAYALGGLAVGVLLLRTALPRAFEVIPLGFFIAGPLIPDVQAWLARRRYAKALAGLVDDMAQEALDRSQYQPLGLEEVAGPDDAVHRGDSTRER
jgi:hypothetical protein